MQTTTFQQIADYHLNKLKNNQLKNAITPENIKLAAQIRINAELLKTASQEQAIAIIANLAMLQTEWRSL